MNYYYTAVKNKGEPDRWQGKLYHYNVDGDIEIVDGVTEWVSTKEAAIDDILLKADVELSLPEVGDTLEPE
jgi:hypothetical protein